MPQASTSSTRSRPSSPSCRSAAPLLGGLAGVPSGVMALRSLLLSFVLLLAGAVSVADASTAGVQGQTLSITGGGGERNRLAVSVSGASLRVIDSGATLRPGPGCAQSGPDVLCPTAGLAEIVVDAGDRGDRVTLSRSVTLRSRVRGGTGDDTLVGGGGPDELDGGTGRDVASYAGAPGAVSVTLGGGADDGLPGEGDNVLATETVVGSPAGDMLNGGGASERIEGRGGDDRIDGGGGSDTLVGGGGADALGGGSGNDRFQASSGADGSDVFTGGAGADLVDYGRRAAGVVADPDGRPDDGALEGVRSATGLVPALAQLSSPEGDLVMTDVESLRGGRGDDVLAAGASGGTIDGRSGTDVVGGGPGIDRLVGGAGFDRLLARDGRADRLDCGTQTDRVFADAADGPGSECEQRSPSFAVLLTAVRRTLENDTARIRVTCPAQAARRCVGAVRLVTVRRLRTPGGRTRPATLGAARFNAPAGASVEVDVRLTREGRAVLDRLGGATRVRAAARGRDEAGSARPTAARFILRAP